MRYDIEITLIESTTKYNPDLGRHVKVETKTTTNANVNDLARRTQLAEFGNVLQGRLIIRLNGVWATKVDYIDIDLKRYQIEDTRRLRRDTVFVVKEV